MKHWERVVPLIAVHVPFWYLPSRRRLSRLLIKLYCLSIALITQAKPISGLQRGPGDVDKYESRRCRWFGNMAANSCCIFFCRGLRGGLVRFTSSGGGSRGIFLLILVHMTNSCKLTAHLQSIVDWQNKKRTNPLKFGTQGHFLGVLGFNGSSTTVWAVGARFITVCKKPMYKHFRQELGCAVA